MRLDELLDAVGDHVPGARLVAGSGDVEITGLTHDSRAVEAGWCFACIPGTSTDGHRFALDAVARGASALLTERRLALDVAEVQVPDTRAALGWFADALWGRPSRRLDVVGVTGTNGKTTVTHLVAHLLETAGRPTAVLGTLHGTRTTPEAADLHRWLAARAAAGDAAAAIEVSSHGLVLRRVDGVRFAVAVFTNLGRDHLDFHADLRAYFEAKAGLFTADRSALGVVCADDLWGRRLLDGVGVPGPPAPMVAYGLDDAADLVVDRNGARFTWRGHDVRLPLLGRFNVANALAAATAASALGVPDSTVAGALCSVRPVPGRFEVIQAAEHRPAPIGVVDYAHTPDALAVALQTAREVAGSGRVLVVFGCGGDRDRRKRPRMGEVAARGADVAVVTSDNPRGEDPDAIIAEVVSSTSGLRVEPDRRLAIFAAVAEAGPDDVVLVAGKGHERTQTVGARVLPFDDREVLAAALASVAGT